MTRLLLALALLALVVLLASCESAVVTGAPCTRSSDCPASLVCRFGACRTECRETRDCPLGAECLPSAEGGACALASDRCSTDEECTAPLVCGADGECRAACLDDDDCTDDGECVLAGRLVCVAREPSAPSPCFVEGEGDFTRGLADWCVETSAGVDPSVVSLVPGPLGDAAVVDLVNAPVGSWARISQETPFRTRDHWTFDLLELGVEGGVTVTAIELVGDDGSLLGRIGMEHGGGDCTETGRPTGTCLDGGGYLLGGFGVGGAASIAYANVDLRRVARARRVFEVVRTRDGVVRSGLEHVSVYTPICALAWWPSEPHLVALDLDDPLALSSGAMLTPADQRVRLFDIGVCEQAPALDGTSSIDVSIAPTDGPRTLSFFWHPTRMGEPFEGATLVREIDGDLELVVRGNTLTARAGRCGSAPALEVLDDGVLGSADRRWQEVQVFVDRSAGTLCLARAGKLVRCETTPACPLAPSTATGLRFGELTTELTGREAIGIDEIRVDDARTVPSLPAMRSGACYLDRTCFDYDVDGVRDAGSGECVLPSECTSIALCPRGAIDPGPDRCSSEPVRMPCGWDSRRGPARCPQGVAHCGTGTCPNWYALCEEPVAADFATCTP